MSALQPEEFWVTDDRQEPESVEVRLRDVTPDDLPIFFEHQRDPDAVHMAAFTTSNPSDRDAFNLYWQRIMSSETVTVRTVLVDACVAGHILSYMNDGTPEVSYWIGHEFWGRGVATRALRLFLNEMSERPIYARAAADNAGSIRVLQKCGFTICGQYSGFANARGEIIPEVFLRTDL
jgi:RimJ/RimL family protein N-acetyltransferase